MDKTHIHKGANRFLWYVNVLIDIIKEIPTMCNDYTVKWMTKYSLMAETIYKNIWKKTMEK